MYRVVYQVFPSGQYKEKFFDSWELCRKFVCKIRHTPQCRLVIHPNYM